MITFTGVYRFYNAMHHIDLFKTYAKTIVNWTYTMQEHIFPVNIFIQISILKLTVSLKKQ